MKKIASLIIVAFVSLSVIANENKRISTRIKKTFEDNLKYCNTENIQGMMSTIHSKSSANASTKKTMTQVNKIYDLKYQIISFKYLTTTGDYAIARVIQKTTKIKGPTFRSNIIDSLQIFKKENGLWKVWSSSILSIKFL